MSLAPHLHALIFADFVLSSCHSLGKLDLGTVLAWVSYAVGGERGSKASAGMDIQDGEKLPRIQKSSWGCGPKCPHAVSGRGLDLSQQGGPSVVTYFT